MLDFGADLGIVQKSGSWYSFEQDRIGQGRETAREYLIEHSKTQEKIKKLVLEAKQLARSKAKEAEPKSDAVRGPVPAAPSGKPPVAQAK